MNELLNRLGALTDVGQQARGRLAILLVVVVFFLAVLVLRALLKVRVSPSKVMPTLKLALLGLVLLLVETWTSSPQARAVVTAVQSLVVLWCAANLVTYLLVDVYCWVRMDRHVPSFIRDLTTLLVYVAFALLSLRAIFHLDVSAILTTTTVLTAAVAFAMQATLSNIVSGFYVENDDSLRTGTWIRLEDKDLVGEIVNVGFRYVTVRTPDNHRVMVPHSTVSQGLVTWLGRRDSPEKMAAHLRIGLPYELPPEKAIALLTRVLLTEPHVVRDPAPTVIVYAYLDSAIEYDLKYYLEHYSLYRPTRGSILAKAWYAVTREGYAFPFPHRELITVAAQQPFPVPPEQVLAAVRATDLLGTLSPEELDRLARSVKPRVFGAGEVVVQQGDEGHSLFLVRQGQLQVLLDGKPVATLRSGQVFGEMSLLTGEPRKATVVAAGEVHLVEVGREHLEPILKGNPALLEKLSTLLAAREEQNAEHRKRAELAQAGPSRRDVLLRKLRTFFDMEA